MAKTSVKVELVGQDGNSIFILGKVSKALKQAGHIQLAQEFQKEAMSGDYDHLLKTVMDYVEVQ